VEEDEPSYWDIVLNHTGNGLTEAIRKDEFFKSQNIVTGGEYLKAWLACLIKDPFEPLPFLATVGGEDSGKSILHEAVNEFLFTKGVVSGNLALTEYGGFNGALEGALLVYVEELNLNRNPAALTRLKEWTTARRLAIRRMRTDVYHVASTCHFFYACNDYAFIPALPGDTRIIVLTVNRPANPIPKPKLMKGLKRQARAFLADLKEMKLPEQIGRLRLPLVETDEKAEIQENNSPFFGFFNDHCVVEHDARVKRADVFAAYDKWREREGHKELSASEIGKQLQTLTCGRIGRTTLDGATAYRHLRLKA
jgi:phage/plasmid-associated DNA primase